MPKTVTVLFFFLIISLMWPILKQPQTIKIKTIKTWLAWDFWWVHQLSAVVLLLAGTELIFFLLANMMRLCFGFVLKTVLIALRCFNYCWEMLARSQGLFCYLHHPTTSHVGIPTWEVVHEFLVFLYLHTQLLLYLLNRLYLNSWVYSILLLWFSPPSDQGGWVSKWLSSAELLAGVNSWQLWRLWSHTEYFHWHSWGTN